jgi:hypothetical protein
MYIYNFLFRMTDTMIPQNVDLFSWDILYTPDIYTVDIYNPPWSYYCEMLLATYQTTTCNMAEDGNLNITSTSRCSNCRKATPSAAARDPVRARTLWDASARLVGLGEWDPCTAEVLPSDGGEITKL